MSERSLWLIVLALGLRPSDIIVKNKFANTHTHTHTHIYTHTQSLLSKNMPACEHCQVVNGHTHYHTARAIPGADLVL